MIMKENILDHTVCFQ